MFNGHFLNVKPEIALQKRSENAYKIAYKMFINSPAQKYFG